MEVLSPAEHALDGVVTTIQIGREAVLPLAIGLWRDVGNASQFLHPMTHRIATASRRPPDAFAGAAGIERLLRMSERSAHRTPDTPARV